VYFRILGEHTLLSGWFSVSIRQPCPYKFEVKETTEKLSPKLDDSEDKIINNFSKHLLLAHGDPVMIKHECKILLADLQDLNLSIIKNYIETEILPEKKSGFQLSTWIGNFGETLAASILIDSEGFWFPIYKLRFREKKDWAMKLTDLCLIKTNGLNKPLICYGEVKTKSSSCNVKLGIEGHDSLIKDDALQDPEILKFFRTILYSMNKFDEAEFFSKIGLGKIDYDKQHCLFIVHEQSTWKEEILSNLNAHDLSPHLIDFSVNVVLINQLRKVIDETYSRAWRWVEDIVNG
jgi:hypothetical protein